MENIYSNICCFSSGVHISESYPASSRELVNKTDITIRHRVQWALIPDPAIPSNISRPIRLYLHSKTISTQYKNYNYILQELSK